MTTVAFQNDSKLTFIPIYFANKFGDPQFFLHLKISFSLSDKYEDLKKILFFYIYPIFKKTKLKT